MKEKGLGGGIKTLNKQGIFFIAVHLMKVLLSVVIVNSY